ncbi:PadR family transcriptional regulator [Plantactinospora soyae]|uniref:DNA-binding PadR family transcriptional regulator n=1 Tax=Plantactinospora soyae TaxID=1544732 RepID=A0A927RAE5_9ACTN|nr:PadR family transcriptional regulator [Plantactinospora soyae]MBE1490681.1 DNA-binding PadR family transcriptional regulator [Plantactinospora soyae]
MNLSRLMVLGLLASQGALHGHQIKLIARDTEVAQWGGIGIGALYRELRVMDDERLVRAVAVEQVGRRPVRTVYEITDAGRQELRTLRERAVCELRFGPDPLPVALLFGRVGDPSELAGFLDRRREVLAATIADLDAERDEHLAQGRIGALDAALFHRQVILLEAELRWLDEFGSILTTAEEPPQ